MAAKNFLSRYSFVLKWYIIFEKSIILTIRHFNCLFVGQIHQSISFKFFFFFTFPLRGEASIKPLVIIFCVC